MTEDDEEIEIVPHIKGSLDFEVYEQVEIQPKETILPWDDNVKPIYNLSYKAKGKCLSYYKYYNFNVVCVCMCLGTYIQTPK